MTLQQLAEAIGAELVGDGTRIVEGCAPIQVAGEDEVAFLANQKYARYLESTKAAAVIVDSAAAKLPAAVGLARGSDRALLVAGDPYFAFRGAMIELHGFRAHPGPMDCAEAGTVSPRAAIHPTAVVDESAVVHPFAVVESGAHIGPESVLYPGVFIGEHAHVGAGCVLYPNAVVYDRCVLGDRVTLHANCVIGNDGFGYATHDGVHHKIPQHGIVVIEDDVELGAGCAIERAAMGETRVGRGSKFADLISIGHGTTIGEHCLFVSLVGVAGSVEVGKYVVLGGQVGVSGHLSIGDFVQAAGKTAIISDIPANMKVGGMPAIEFSKAKRNALVGSELAELARRVRQLEQRLSERR